MTQVVLTSGATWQVPAGVTSLTLVEVWGAGAGGAAFNDTSNAGGGGGGGYSNISNLSVTSLATLTISIGVAGKGETGSAAATAGTGTYFNGTSLASCSVSANGGSASSGTAGGAGGTTTGIVGTVKNAGGPGATGSSTNAGSGGGSSGTVNAVGGTGAAGTSTNGGAGGNANGGGTGGAGGTSGSPAGGAGGSNQAGGGGGGGTYDTSTDTGGAGGLPGGGGGCASTDNGGGIGGAGGGGQIVITYTTGSVTVYGSFWDAIFPHKQRTTVKYNLQDTTLPYFILNPVVSPIEAWLGNFPTQLNVSRYPNRGISSYQYPYPNAVIPAPLGYGPIFPNYSVQQRLKALARLSNILGPTGTGAGGIPFTPSTGPLRFIFYENSQTLGTVQPYNDGKINVPSITVNNMLPLVTAARMVMQKAGAKARPYKMEVIQNGVVLFTLRSIIWTTYMIGPTEPAYQVIDGQTLNSSYV